MNTSALKAFAPTVRKQLIEAVSRKLDFALTARTPDYLDTYATQVRSLRELATEDRKGLIERVAYTWFNRLAALRYLDARNWHPFHVKVLMAATATDTLPELFTVARLGAAPEELRRYIDSGRMEALLQGRIPSADPQGEVYRLLVLAACRFYNEILPDVFERLDDETELLLPDDLLTEQSVAQGFRTEITDEDCEQVEVLGWLYQFYISEKKDQVMARKAAVPAEDIPAVSQLFTPHWIVRYLVENSLGRLWLLNRPESLLKAWMPYYIESSEPDTAFLRIERPQNIRLCDPAVGSGHMLTYAFDLLYVIYEEEGYTPSEIPALILRHNLTGIEIDCRAAQLAALALTLKAREKSGRFFQKQHFVRPNIIELRNVHFSEGELPRYSEALGLGGLFTPSILRLMHQFEETKNLGSLIQPCVGESDIAFARGAVEARDLGSNLFLNDTHKKVLRVLEQAEALTQRYQVVVANPPYMTGGMNGIVVNFIDKHFSSSRTDLSATFISRSQRLCLRMGYCSLVTMQSWMFVNTLADFRTDLLSRVTFINLTQHGVGAFPSLNSKVVQTVAFVLIVKEPSDQEHPVCFRLLDHDADVKEQQLLSGEHRFDHLRQVDFSRIIGSPFAYWISYQMLASFQESPIRDRFVLKEGLGTRNDEYFLRCFWEVSVGRIRAPESPTAKWVKTDKAGVARKWYGNLLYLMNWEHDGHEIRNYRNPDGSLKSRPQNTQYFFREAVTWGKVGTIAKTFRYRGDSLAFVDAAPSAFGTDLLYLLALLNSKVFEALLEIQGDTLHVPLGVVAMLPFMEIEGKCEELHDAAQACIERARTDWDNFETSWDFQEHPLTRSNVKAQDLESSWSKWQTLCNIAVDRMQERETENNRLFIDAYGLQNELIPEVPKEQITLARADRRRDVASFLSYAIGCTMGRYSVDRPGLILANVGDTLSEYLAKVDRAPENLTFTPDRDGIIPVLDGEWFADDIVARTREFLKATFGEGTLRENVRFVEESLGRDLRAYYLTDFYKDHLQTYKKRPIYWMVQSPRKGFSVLIYLHRYTRDTMNVILNRHLREFQMKLRSKIEHLQQVSSGSSASVREKSAAVKEAAKLTKTLHECEEWERQTILPLAQARIELDLDDGVKVNYQKLGEALVKIPGFEAAEE
ncbi:BREX-1 system adenine-specific DNA-methyltransferase PglX [Tunturibacter psychrotolerans]|uniref:site-specific DNA-methyltransferase (adenine-specific) n=1 Tax=Tunturiibacter psychrotolerans TaxID=3069686 RepID=A0AAU7ZSG2_9BACT